MNAYTTVNILDMIEAIGEDGVNLILSDFSCPLNGEIEHFVKDNAVDFAKRKLSVTYLVMDDQGNLVAIFALTHKAVRIGCRGLSVTAQKKLGRFAQLDDDTDSYTVSAFLIAQFGKNYSDSVNESLSGDILMETALNILSSVQHDIGGGVVYLECEDKPPLLSFYKNENNCFREFGERYATEDDTKYIQLLRFL